MKMVIIIMNMVVRSASLKHDAVGNNCRVMKDPDDKRRIYYGEEKGLSCRI